MKKIEKSIELGGRKLVLSTGHVAEQATSAVMASYGETVVLVTVMASDSKEDRGYFPLFVEYRERLYAGGRIKGSRWVKREGRPSDNEILTGRLIDRSIRPLFPKDYKKEVQVIIAVLSVDLENNPDIVSAIAVSAALAVSPIPWQGPVGVVKVGLKDNIYTTNPTDPELPSSNMELIISSTSDAVVMIEASAKEVPEEKILEGIAYAQKEVNKVIALIDGFAKAVGVKKEAVEKRKIDTGLQKKVKELAAGKIKDLIKNIVTRQTGDIDYGEVRDAVAETFADEEKDKAVKLFDELFSQEVRKMILSGKRPDGRAPDEVRKLSAQVGILPRTHGSALFQRGQTQVLTVVTLGSPSLEQLIESALGEETKRYMHHYSMPPYSVGETGRIGWPARREIGHGALAEKALLPLIPAEDAFPYTIRVVSEILSSNGSTSMASVCGSTLSLMDAGVPIKAPVAGIAMGGVLESEKKFVVLTDITGMEDGNGDMDLKVAGTADGITALQLDVKALKLSLPILTQALNSAKKARGKILEVITATLAKPRAKVSIYAPKIKVIKIPQDKIGEVIGPGGKIIRNIIAETGAQVDVEDDGTVNVSGMSDEEVNAAASMVEALTKEAKAGEIYEGEVKRIQPFGAFVEILPGKDGLVHVSDMSQEYVSDPSEIVSIGDKIKVRVKEIDDLGRINLSMLLSGDKKRESFGRRGRDRDSKPTGGRRTVRFRAPGRSQPKTRGGPHFPTSRLLDKKGFSR
jgi:polyribonucleotide nucleotidyltransferase